MLKTVPSRLQNLSVSGFVFSSISNHFHFVLGRDLKMILHDTQIRLQARSDAPGLEACLTIKVQKSEFLLIEGRRGEQRRLNALSEPLDRKSVV